MRYKIDTLNNLPLYKKGTINNLNCKRKY